MLRTLIKEGADALVKLSIELTVHCPSSEQGYSFLIQALCSQSRAELSPWCINRPQHTDISANQHPLHVVPYIPIGHYRTSFSIPQDVKAFEELLAHISQETAVVSAEQKDSTTQSNPSAPAAAPAARSWADQHPQGFTLLKGEPHSFTRPA